jgi:hypothetical protein
MADAGFLMLDARRLLRRSMAFANGLDEEIELLA